MWNQNGKIYSLIQHYGMETKQKTNQVIMVMPTQDPAPRQPVVGTKDRSSVATVPRTAKFTDRLQQVYHTEATHHKAEISVKITTRSFLIKHEQL